MLGTSLVSAAPRSRKLYALAITAALTAPLAVALLGASPHASTCAPPLEVAALAARDRGFVAREAMACAAHEHGAITDDAFAARVAQLDADWDRAPAAPPPVRETQWAASVRGVSSQYTATSWSAAQVLGPPNVYPSAGDNAQAWASLGADSGPEWIEVGYAQPVPIRAVKIAETLAPGAVSRVELVTTSGARVLAASATAAPAGVPARMLQIDVACTQEPIAAVRVYLDSAAVPGWNELDAIGVEPCGEP